jgi:Putative prokaryotic signal transducing protein
MAEEETSDDGMEMVTIFNSPNHDAEQEALEIHALLESEGISSVVIGPSVIPSLEFRVEVPRRHVEEAQKIIADARAAGPAAAEEAEAASEESV